MKKNDRPTTIPDVIMELRMYLGGVETLAGLIDVSRQAVHYWLAGTRKPNIKNFSAMMNIAKQRNIPLDEKFKQLIASEYMS